MKTCIPLQNFCTMLGVSKILEISASPNFRAYEFKKYVSKKVLCDRKTGFTRTSILHKITYCLGLLKRFK